VFSGRYVLFVPTDISSNRHVKAPAVDPKSRDEGIHGSNFTSGLYDCDLRHLTPLNPELNPICYLLALLAHHFLHVSRIMVKSLTPRLLMSYIYGAHILDVSRSHTTTQHSR